MGGIEGDAPVAVNHVHVLHSTVSCRFLFLPPLSWTLDSLCTPAVP